MLTVVISSFFCQTLQQSCALWGCTARHFKKQNTRSVLQSGRNRSTTKALPCASAHLQTPHLAIPLKHLRFRKNHGFWQIRLPLADSLALQNTNRTIQETETRITTARENEKLLIENARKEQQRTTAIALGIAAVLLVGGVGGTLYFRTRAASARRLLEESERTSRAVVQATFNGVEQERKRVQRELHDGVQSKLVAAKIVFSSMEGVIAEQAPHRAADFMRTLNGFGATISEISAIAQNLIPANFEETGLALAVEDYIGAMRPVMPRTAIILNVDNIRTTRFAPDRELSAFRLVQEIVNNCRKHAAAESLVLDFTLENRTKAHAHSHEQSGTQWLIITGEDEGIGFSVENLGGTSTMPKRGLGLSTMQNRVHALGGTITIDSEPQRGTRIVAAIPLEI
jgi:two-component system, NarL family, sensor kinase